MNPNQLRAFIERIERLDEEIASLNADKSDLFKEAKGAGYDVKVMRAVLKLRRTDKAERDEFDAVLDLYLSALGMLPGEPHVHVHEAA
jgi:uncharacterized protein (UPF0335 family)